MNAKRSEGKPREPWKRKMGTEFSGLERTRDFVIAIAVWVVIVVIAMVIAFFAFN